LVRFLRKNTVRITLWESNIEDYNRIKAEKEDIKGKKGKIQTNPGLLIVVSAFMLVKQYNG